MNKLFRCGTGEHWHIISLLILLLLFSSCSRDSDTDTEGEQGTGRTVRKEIRFQLEPMISGTDNGATRATTKIPLTQAEAKLHNYLLVLQFDGTDDNSVLFKVGRVEDFQLETSSSITGMFPYDFEVPEGGGPITVMVVANVDDVSIDGLREGKTKLGMFKEKGLVWLSPVYENTLETTGLPMMATQSFDLTTDVAPTFKLKSLLAKVVFSYELAGGYSFSAGCFCIENVGNGMSIGEHASGATAWHPVDVDYTSEALIVDGDVYNGEQRTVYLPENLAGRNATITKDSERGGTNVPEGATYIWVSTFGNSKLPTLLSRIDYCFYLGDGTPQDFNMVRNHQYIVHAKLKGASGADKRVYLETANCYMIDPDSYYNNKTYVFHATVMGNGATTPDAGANAPAIVPTALKPATAKVLWEQSDPTGASNAAGDVIQAGSVSVVDGTYIQFTTGTKPGNAVIGAFDASNNLIWSWHIWRPASTLSTVACHTTANGGRDFRMMDRNLGAFNNSVNDVKAYGLMYQWGRKDPFPGATGVSANDAAAADATFKGVIEENGYHFAAVEATTGITVQEAVQTPMSFYYKTTSPKDWMSTKNDNLWGNPYTKSVSRPNPDLGSKSIYDPCPPGYRVPPQDTWSQATASNFTRDTNGHQLGVGTGAPPAKYFYPAAGFRWGDSDKGKLASATGTSGCYWASSPYSSGNTSAGYLHFNSSNVYPEYNAARTNGISVRCAEE